MPHGGRVGGGGGGGRPIYISNHYRSSGGTSSVSSVKSFCPSFWCAIYIALITVFIVFGSLYIASDRDYINVSNNGN